MTNIIPNELSVELIWMGARLPIRQIRHRHVVHLAKCTNDSGWMQCSISKSNGRKWILFLLTDCIRMLHRKSAAAFSTYKYASNHLWVWDGHRQHLPISIYIVACRLLAIRFDFTCTAYLPVCNIRRLAVTCKPNADPDKKSFTDFSQEPRAHFRPTDGTAARQTSWSQQNCKLIHYSHILHIYTRRRTSTSNIKCKHIMWCIATTPKITSFAVFFSFFHSTSFTSCCRCWCCSASM